MAALLTWVPEDLDTFLPVAKATNYRKGEIIYQGGSTHLCWIVGGMVSVRRKTSGDEVMHLGLYGGGEVFGESCLGPTDATEYAVAHGDCELMAWTPAEINRILQAKPAMWYALAAMMLDRMHQSLQRIEEAATMSIRQRLAATLARFAGKFGVPVSDGVLLFPLTHEFLAEEIGTSREIVTMAMNALRNSGAVQYSRKSMRLNLSILRQISEARHV